MDQSLRELRWLEVLSDFRHSGLTRVQFCKLRGISLHSFRYWLYRLQHGLPAPRPRSTRRNRAPTHLPARIETPAFLPVDVRPRPLVSAVGHHVIEPPTPLELVLSDRAHLRVHAGFDPAEQGRGSSNQSYNAGVAREPVERSEASRPRGERMPPTAAFAWVGVRVSVPPDRSYPGPVAHGCPLWLEVV